MSTFVYWNLVVTFVFAGLCFTFIELRRKYQKRWLDWLASACVVGALVSLIVAAVHQ